MSSGVLFRRYAQDVTLPRGRQAEKPSLFGKHPRTLERVSLAMAETSKRSMRASEPLLEGPAPLVRGPLLPRWQAFLTERPTHQEHMPSSG